MKKKLLRLERINKSYDGRQILEDLDLTIHENEFVTVTGSVKKIDAVERVLVLHCGLCIAIDNIISIRQRT